MNITEYFKANSHKIAAVAVLTLALQGCASTVTKPVSSQDRDQSGVFDGEWSATVVNTPRTQYGPSNWEYTCGDQSGRSLGNIIVSNSIAQTQMVDQQAFVNRDGKFRFEIPMGEVAAASGSSDSTITNGGMTFIVYGSLKEAKGSMVYGIAEFGNTGCRSSVEFKRLR